MAALKHPIDRQGTLYVDGEMCSEGLFHTNVNAGLYVHSLKHSNHIPTGKTIVLNPDIGENIDIERIYPCPHGEPHHHFEIEA